MKTRQQLITWVKGLSLRDRLLLQKFMIKLYLVKGRDE